MLYMRKNIKKDRKRAYSFSQLNSLDEHVIIARIPHATLFIHRFTIVKIADGIHALQMK